MGIKLKDAVKGKKTVSFDKKPALYASVCDGCGKVHEMKPFCNDNDLGRLRGTFDTYDVRGDDGKGLGNMFSAIVCSFKCADVLMKGGWKKMKEYKPYAIANANLVRCEVKITSYVVGEDELIKEWKKQEPRKYGTLTPVFCG